MSYAQNLLSYPHNQSIFSAIKLYRSACIHKVPLDRNLLASAAEKNVKYDQCESSRSDGALPEIGEWYR